MRYIKAFWGAKFFEHFTMCNFITQTSCREVTARGLSADRIFGWQQDWQQKWQQNVPPESENPLIIKGLKGWIV